MNRPLCSTSRCHGRGHKDGCDTADCRGCLPRPAGDGKYLCFLHEKWLAEDAVEAARLYDELAHRLVGGQSGGEKVSTKPGPRYPDQRAIDARSDIYQTLTLVVGLVVEQRGFAQPEQGPESYGVFVATNAPWLAAHPKAAEVSDAFYALAHGKARSVAYPSGSSLRQLDFPCPADDCVGELMALMRPGDALLPPEVFCSTNEEHRWQASEWRLLDRLVSGRRVA